MGLARRGTTNRNDRGSAEGRRRRKQWLLDRFGDGVQAPCSFMCGTMVTFETLYVDRFPITGAEGGRYVRGNIRPSCGDCNSFHGGHMSSGQFGLRVG